MRLLGGGSLIFSLLSVGVNSQAADTFTNVTIFTPPSNYTTPKTLYARTLLLNQNCETDNVLLSTWENYSPEPPSVYFPIYKSTNLGESWQEISRVTDQVNGWGLRYQPFLYEMPQAIGNYSAGTILLAGNSIPTNLSNTQIDLYASTDKGYTWNFVSHIAAGGEALPDNGLTPVWEPFILTYNNQLVVYYSDQRDPAHGQKLVHQTSTDLRNWAVPVDDVAYSNYTFRPGMTTVAQLPTGQYIMTYEFYGAPEADFAVYYRISENPLNFNNATGQVVRASDGVVPTSSPYIVWSEAGGPNGTIVVSSGNDEAIFLNQELGNSANWTRVDTPAAQSYTRSLRVLPGQEQVLIVGGGVLNGANNSVQATTVNIGSNSSSAGDFPPFARCEKDTYRRRRSM
ncbi:glycoside hydrolase family 93 protein [Viridothelium virens]|uniref:Glycoside hydrolase family 93 protein n=1 Tax=Viridothelium virens TaxID=1048519 RepID=A0A6A6HCS3_VIRVR|nr:glycoside hydrolase family 93 protein [Viridothelium virens]